MNESLEERPDDPVLPLVRFFFALPEPVGLPDGYHALVLGDDCDLDTPGWASLIIHQVTTPSGRTAAAAQALIAACDRAGGLPSRATSSLGPDFEAAWTVVEATTLGVGPRGPDQPNDPFMRCCEAADQLVRAYRLATEEPCGLPAYVRIPFPVLAFAAEGSVKRVVIDGVETSVLRPINEPWTGPSVHLLDHFNLPDPVREPHEDDELAAVVHHWLIEQSQRNPLRLGRERLIEARRAHAVLGEEGQAVVLANTACEVFLDTLLALLLWEEQVAPENVVELFEEGKALRRLSQELAPRLKGNLSTKSGPVGDWYLHCYRIRHRVIHGGYSPTTAEAERAIETAIGFQRRLLDRLADRRNQYPRSAMVALGQPGLERRRLWSGQIIRFFETQGPAEPSWTKSYSAWHGALIEALTPEAP